MQLVFPADTYLPGYVHALQSGWSPDNLRPDVAGEELELEWGPAHAPSPTAQPYALAGLELRDSIATVDLQRALKG